ncbi:MAG: molybdopterin molybdotransferase MoeA [Polyangiaceae bacterium]|nr:molybdopterin molybdotransferase MoeA [Polyangiaceae bacterium]
MRDVRMKGFRSRTSVPNALAILEGRTGRLPVESVHVRECVGRVAAEPIAARIAVPHFARAAMDGYALQGESTFGANAYTPVELFVVGEVRAGRGTLPPIGKGEAVRITTGAPVPEGADAVLMAEYAEEVPLDESRSAPPHNAIAIVRAREAVAPGKHVGRVGEDVPAGMSIVSAGRKLRPQDAGVLASTGISSVPVVRRPSVRVLITGDELVEPGNIPTESTIVDSNSVMLRALALRDGASDVEIEYVRDAREAVYTAMRGATEDVILVSGGSSVGPEDHAPLVLEELGEVAVHGVALRPASPTGFGFLQKGMSTQTVFLLPGNPVSCLCAYEIFAGPTVRALGGRSRAWPHRTRRCTVAAKIVSELGRTDYTRVKVEGDRVTPIMTSGASILSSTTRADGVVIVDEGHEGYREGEEISVFLYDD